MEVALTLDDGCRRIPVEADADGLLDAHLRLVRVDAQSREDGVRHSGPIDGWRPRDKQVHEGRQHVGHGWRQLVVVGVVVGSGGSGLSVGGLRHEGVEDLLQLRGHVAPWLGEGRVDALHLLLLGEAVVVRDDTVEDGAVEAKDVTERAREVEGQRVAVTGGWLVAGIVQLPVFGDDRRGGEAVIRRLFGGCYRSGDRRLIIAGVQR